MTLTKAQREQIEAIAEEYDWDYIGESPHKHDFKQTKRKCDIATLW